MITPVQPIVTTSGGQPGDRKSALLAGSGLCLIVVASIIAYILRFQQGVNELYDGTPAGLATLLYSDILFPVLGAALGSSGALIARYRPGNAVGWLCLSTGLCMSLSQAGGQLATGISLTNADQEWMAFASAQVANIFLVLAVGLLIIFLPLFPDGQWLGKGWKVFAWLTGGLILMHILGEIFAPTINSGDNVFNNSWGISPFALEDVNDLCFPLEMLFALIATSSLVWRWIKGKSTERLQIKWLFFMFLVILLSGMIAIALYNLLPEAQSIAVIIGALSIAGISIGFPATIGIALLRYRLYDIDLLVNRTLVYGSLILLLSLLYIAGVLILQFVISGTLPAFLQGSQQQGGGGFPPGGPGRAIRPPATGSTFTGFFSGLIPTNSPLSNVLSTLGIAGLFQPVRARLQRAIDRRFYRKRYEAAQAIQAFSNSLRNQIDLEDLHLRLLTVVTETMQPEYVSLWNCQPVRPRISEEDFTGSLEPVMHSTGLLPVLNEKKH